MKKIITAIVALVMLTASATFAHDTNKKNSVEELVEQSFHKQFAGAENVSFTKVNELYKAQFNLNGQVMFAYLNEDGVLLGAYRNIVTAQLPITLMAQLKEQYADFWITELFELAKDNQTNYFITVENGDQKLILKSEQSSNWLIKSKFRK
jgi:hypothetical protein